MGQKVNPVGLRLGVNRTWDSRWFAGRGEYGRLLHEDMRMRDHILQQRRQAGIAKVVIERPHKKCRVTVHTARPGVLIGKKGADIEKLRGQLARFTSSEVHLNIVEIRKPEIDATLVAEAIAQQLERRVAFRRAMKRSVQSALRLGALGIRINVAGRLGGAEIARTEWYREGRVPLHTLRADIDFGYGIAKTAYGIIGIKVWIFKGEIMEHDPMASEKRNTDLQESGGGRPRRDGDRVIAVIVATAAGTVASAVRLRRQLHPHQPHRLRPLKAKAQRRREAALSADKDDKTCCNRNARNSARPSRAASMVPPRVARRSTSARTASRRWSRSASRHAR